MVISGHHKDDWTSLSRSNGLRASFPLGNFTSISMSLSSHSHNNRPLAYVYSTTPYSTSFGLDTAIIASDVCGIDIQVGPIHCI